MRAYLFPGQGSQRVGMGEGLFEAFPELTEAADAILGQSIKQLCLEDPQRQLGQTRYTQPALYVVNALTYRARLNETGSKPDFVAGHSLGEYNALESAGVMSFEDGLKLVKKRGELMSTAPKGTMAAIIRMPAEKVAGVLAASGLSAIDIANYNAPAQTIISGRDDDIRHAQAPFEQNEAMYIPLNVSGAFHSRYMQPVRDEFAAFLGAFSFAAPRIPVIANVSAQPYQPESIASTLTDQLTQPVRWLDSMTFLLQQGVVDFEEMGPGDVLSKLIQTIRGQFKPIPTVAASVVKGEATPRVDAQTLVAAWNQRHPVGIKVRVKGYGDLLTTKTAATILFGHRAAIYMQGYNGYFALDEVEPA
jgi:malonyl CoA-acyl carrier protein transacylase